jgi:hypothetical protein
VPILGGVVPVFMGLYRPNLGIVFDGIFLASACAITDQVRCPSLDVFALLCDGYLWQSLGDLLKVFPCCFMAVLGHLSRRVVLC